MSKIRNIKVESYTYISELMVSASRGEGAEILIIEDKSIMLPVLINALEPLKDSRITIGNWEVEIVSGANHKGYLVILLECKSGLLRLGGVRNKSSEFVKAEIISLLRSLRVCTTTYDNGKEFVGHGDVNEALKSKSYFCHLYSAWERGSNENTNGLLRKYFPKDRELLNVTQNKTRSSREIG